MSNAVAMITGASRGIGRGIAIALAQHGYDIAACATKAVQANTESGLYEVKQHVEQAGCRFLPVVGDIANLDDHPSMLRDVLEKFGAVDLLVNNAGVGVLKRLDILETTSESFDRVIGINLRGPFFLSQLVANQMIKQVESGAEYAPKMVFITSVSAEAASPNRAEYCISKAGLSMAAQNFAVHLAPHGINVYEIRPGVIKSDMTAGVKEKYDKLIAEGLLLQRRWGTPEDVGNAVVALAEGYFDYATGAVIEVGGGYGVKRL